MDFSIFFHSCAKNWNLHHKSFAIWSSNILAKIYANFQVPDPRIWFFVRLSGFSKSAFLEPTWYGEFPDAKNFPDKIGPGSGFLLKRWFYNICLNSWYKFLQNHQKLRFFMSLTFPDTGIRFFGQLSGFSKSTYLDSTYYVEFADVEIRFIFNYY